MIISSSTLAVLSVDEELVKNEDAVVVDDECAHCSDMLALEAAQKLHKSIIMSYL